MRRTVPGLVLCLISRGTLADDASQAQELAVADRAVIDLGVSAISCSSLPMQPSSESKRLDALEKVQTALHLWVKILLQLSVKFYDPHQARGRAAQQALATASSGIGAVHEEPGYSIVSWIKGKPQVIGIFVTVCLDLFFYRLRCLHPAFASWAWHCVFRALPALLTIASTMSAPGLVSRASSVDPRCATVREMKEWPFEVGNQVFISSPLATTAFPNNDLISSEGGALACFSNSSRFLWLRFSPILLRPHRELLSSKAMVANVAEKSEQDFGRHD